MDPEVRSGFERVADEYEHMAAAVLRSAILTEGRNGIPAWKRLVDVHERPPENPTFRNREGS
jgi:hypothetical protein